MHGQDIDIINSDVTVFAETNYRSQLKRFGIKENDRSNHMYVIGKTGTGKSTLLENLVIQDLKKGKGLALIDPHGDMVERILNFVPNYRVNDVIYFNPADVNYPVGFNVMEVKNEAEKHLVSSGLISVFKKLWSDSWGPRLEYVLRNCILALLENEGSTLLGIMKLLVDRDYRARIVRHLKDPIVRNFWEEEFAKYPERFQAQAISPIQNKVGQFLSSSLIRNILGQVKSSFDLSDIMKTNKILLMNLSKGRIGEDASALLGAMMVTKLQLTAMERIHTPKVERENFYLYVDEFQNFATDSFADILSEARKYKLCLILAHQYLEQVEEKLRAALFGNVGTLITFRLGSLDAEIIARELYPTFSAQDILKLDKYQIYLKLSIDGTISEPFSAITLQPAYEGGNQNVIEKVSRERYAISKTIIEDKIERWSQSNTSTFEAVARVGKKSRESDLVHGAEYEDMPPSLQTTPALAVALVSDSAETAPKKPQKSAETLEKIKHAEEEAKKSEPAQKLISTPVGVAPDQTIRL